MPLGEFGADLRSSPQLQVSDTQRAKLQQAMEFIQAHCTERIDLKDAAAAAGLSMYHFHRIFHAHFGKTVKFAITECQIELAKRLLLDGVETVEVGKRVGFANQSHLTARFKLITGSTPAAWRRAQLQTRNAATKPSATRGGSKFSRSKELDAVLREAARLRDAADQLIRLAQKMSEQPRDPNSSSH